jgi:hypothetical protein
MGETIVWSVLSSFLAIIIALLFLLFLGWISDRFGGLENPHPEEITPEVPSVTELMAEACKKLDEPVQEEHVDDE